MIRTVISLDENDKAWLDRQAALLHLPMTEVVREAVRLLRSAREQSGQDVDDLLSRTSGCWQQGDGLDWQRELRDEWTR